MDSTPFSSHFPDMSSERFVRIVLERLGSDCLVLNMDQATFYEEHDGITGFIDFHVYDAKWFGIQFPYVNISYYPLSFKCSLYFMNSNDRDSSKCVAEDEWDILELIRNNTSHKEKKRVLL